MTSTATPANYTDLSQAERAAQLRANVPTDLREHPQWVVWALRGDDKKLYNARTRQAALSTNPDTWCSFEEAVAAFERQDRFHGVAFVLSADDPFVCIDLDDCIAPGGVVAVNKQTIIDQLDSYTEVSPSGAGVHVWIRGVISGDRCRAPGIEMYEDARFMTVTGSVLRDQPIEERTEQLAALYEQTFGTPEVARNTRGWRPSPPLLDDEVLDRVRNAQNSAKFERLFDHRDISEYADDDSRADAALLQILAFYTQDDEQLDRLVRQSALYREKWDREDYRERTIAFVLENLTETYQVRQPTVAEHSVRVVTPFSEIAMRAVDWLWFPYIPLGKPTELLGDPGLGKSTIAFDLAARVSAGRPMPGGTEGNPLTDLTGPAGVLILSVEDDPEDTIKPRLVAADGELERIVMLRLQTDEGGLMQLTLPDDIEHIRAVVAEREIKLIVIDPVVAHLGDKTDAHRDKDVRRALAPLAEVAREAGLAALGIRHLNKSEDVKNVIYRGGGSIAFAAQSRSVLFVAKLEPEQGGSVGARPVHALSVGKSNVAELAPTWLYEVEPALVGQDERPDGRVKDIIGTRIVWRETSSPDYS